VNARSSVREAVLYDGFHMLLWRSAADIRAERDHRIVQEQPRLLGVELASG
jgi:hypothetical protein